MKKELFVAVILLLVGISYVIYGTLKPKNVLKYSGLQIYEAIRKCEFLLFHGFDMTVSVVGTDYKGELEVTGDIIETGSGYMILLVNKSYRIVEGPMGVQDVQAREIYISVSKPIVAEIAYPPVNSVTEFSELLKNGERVTGDFAITTDKAVTPAVAQKIRNFGKFFYTEPNVKVEIYPSGVLLKINNPIATGDMSGIINLLEGLSIKEFQTSHLFLYRGVENENEINQIKEQTDALVKTYKV